MDRSTWSNRRPDPDEGGARRPDAEQLLHRVAKGDEAAFTELYDLLAAPIFGVVRRVVRDQAQSEEVTQEVLVELWRTAARYDPAKGNASTWAMTIAHRRAVDRVRSAQARSDREQRAAQQAVQRDFDTVSEQVAVRLEREQVRRCLSGLTDLQREAVLLAYYGGRTYPEVAELLRTPLSTIKTRMRDGLIRLRDCLGVTA